MDRDGTAQPIIEPEEERSAPKIKVGAIDLETTGTIKICAERILCMTPLIIDFQPASDYYELFYSIASRTWDAIMFRSGNGRIDAECL